MERLLVCISHHVAEGRRKYLEQVVNALWEYEMRVDVFIDTNKPIEDIFGGWAKVIIHDNLKHPFHLTWVHRQHIAENINNYDYFAYFEDDMLLPWENFKSYIEKFNLLWPAFVPGFVRIEEKDGEKYVSDIPEAKYLSESDIIHFGDRIFTAFKFPFNYHAFWIMPQKELKESMKPDFVRLTDGREFAAMYAGWELGKLALVEIEFNEGKYQIKPECFSYHLPNNYALGDGPNGKIKVEDIFKQIFYTETFPEEMKEVLQKISEEWKP